METLLDIIHVMVCIFLMLVVLLQQGKGGGMGAAFGGGAAQQVFGGRGAGNILTRATAICATIFMLTSMSLAYLSRSDDPEIATARIRKKAERERGVGHSNEVPESAVDPTSPPAGSGETTPEPANSAP